jgi:hypothetical protein
MDTKEEKEPISYLLEALRNELNVSIERLSLIKFLTNFFSLKTSFLKKLRNYLFLMYPFALLRSFGLLTVRTGSTLYLLSFPLVAAFLILMCDLLWEACLMHVPQAKAHIGLRATVP